MYVTELDAEKSGYDYCALASMDTPSLQYPQISLNLRVRGLRPSATVTINDRCNALKAKGRDVIKLGLGQSPFPIPAIVVEALQRHAHEKDYLPVLGLRELRESVAEHHARIFGIKCDPDDVLIGPGSKELMFLLQLSYYGDLIIPSPTWVSYAPQARIVGRNIIRLETSIDNDWFPTANQLEALCEQDPGRPRILILNYPSNPTGRTLSRDRLVELAAVARRYNVIVLSDEIYGKLHHDGAHQSMVPMLPQATIFSGGLSKWCGAGGWRLGLFVFPRELTWLRDAMSAVATETFTSTSAPIQHAAVTAFEDNPELDSYLRYSRKILKLLGSTVYEKLHATGLRVLPPEGGFYVFPDFSPFAGRLKVRGVNNSKELCELILNDTGVALLPGSDFDRPEHELTARIAYVDFDGKAALDAAEKLTVDCIDEAFVMQHCTRITMAIDRICGWLE